MTLTELRKEIEWYIKEGDETVLFGIKKVVEAVDEFMQLLSLDAEKEEWQLIKKLLVI